MKKIITLFICLNTLFLFGQPLLLEEIAERYVIDSAAWELDGKTFYSYDDSNQLIEKKQLQWFKDIQQYENDRLEEWDYQEDGLIEQYKRFDWNPDSAIWEKMHSFQNSYNQDQCLNSRHSFMPPGSTINFEVLESFLYFNANCNLKSRILLEKNSGQLLLPSEKTEYEINTPLTKKYKTFEYDDNTEKYYFESEIIEKFFTPELIESRHTYDTLGVIEKETLYKYDENNNLTNRLNYSYFNGWNPKISSGDSIIYMYNENNQITYKKRYRYNSFDKEFELYSLERNLYYCDGILKQRNFEYFSFGYHHFRFFYKYSEFANCEEKGVQKLNLYPNPSNGEITIESNFLSKGNPQINIYNSLGQIVFIKKIETRFNELNISLKSFSKGIYFLELQNGKDRVSKKLIIARG